MAFLYNPPAPNPYSGSVAELMERAGDIQAQRAVDVAAAQARAQELSGQAWGQAAQNIGQTVGGAVQQVAQLNGPDAQLKRAQAANVGLEGQLTQAQLDQVKRQKEGSAALTMAIQKHTATDQDGKIMPDLDAIASDVSAAGFPDIADSYVKSVAGNQKTLEDLHASKMAHQQKEVDTAGDLAFQAKSPEDFISTVNLYGQFGLLDSQTVNGLVKKATDAGPDGWKSVQGMLQTSSPAFKEQQKELNKPMLLPAGRPGGTAPQIIIPNQAGTATGGVVATGPTPAPIAPKPPEPGSLPWMLNKEAEAQGVSVDDLSNADVTRIQQQYRDNTQHKPALGGMNALYADVDPKSVAQGIKEGTVPPDLANMSRPAAAAVTSELAKQGFNLSRATMDWKATQKFVATANDQQQVRMRQSIQALSDSLPIVRDLAKQWDGGQFPILNSVNLAAAVNGAYGDKAASIATRLQAQIADVTGNLANVYMGGNSPTDPAFKLAGENLKGQWSAKVLNDALDLADKNVVIRKNSLNNVGPSATSPNNPYAPPTPPPATTAQPAAPSAAAAPKVGDIVSVRGQRVKVTAVGPNGQLQGVPVP